MKKRTSLKSSRVVVSSAEIPHDSLRSGQEQTRAALHESVELYQTLVETSPDAIILTDVKGTLIMVNEQAARLLGARQMHELIGMNITQLVAPADRKRAKEMLRLTLENSGVRDERYSMPRSDGTLVQAEVNTALVRDVKGVAEGILGVVRDITQRQRQEAALRDSEVLYRTLTEGALSGVYIVQDGKFTYVNPALAHIFGYTPAEIIGKKAPLDLTFSEDHTLVKDMIRKRLTGEAEAVRYTFRGVHKSGALIFCESLGRVVSLKDSQMIIGTLLDMTRREQVLQELTYRVRFENLITTLATRFINLTTQQVNGAISEALRDIGEFAQVDRSYIFQFDAETMTNTHEWCAPGIKAFAGTLRDIPFAHYAWLLKRIRRSEIVYVPSPAALPKEAASLKQEMKREKIKSMILVPMVCRNTHIGFIGFDAVRVEKAWPDYILALLRIAGAMFANMLERKRMDTDIESLNKELLQTNMKLKQLALRDSLTGLYNHRYFEEVIEAEFNRARRQVSPLSVIMVDIDYFKSINDAYGHQFGDQVLKQLAKQLTQMVRKYDTVIRYGGEEFIIITPGAGRDIALTLAQRLLDVVKLTKFGDKEHKVKLKMSIAVASVPEDKIMRGADFTKLGDEILAGAKESGGDRVFSLPDVRKKTAAGREVIQDVKVLREKLSKLTRHANQSLAEAIFAFAKTIEIKDHYTGSHVEKTVHYATEIAKAMKLSADELEQVRQAAILHDLGKIGIRENILLKETGLSAEEYEEIKNHPQFAVDILRPIHFFHKILPFILHHHERWDGKGYPYGFVGEETPLGARIIAVADTYEAITSDRRYRKADSHEVAMQKIKDSSGTQFDPKVVDVFLLIMEQAPAALLPVRISRRKSSA